MLAAELEASQAQASVFDSSSSQREKRKEQWRTPAEVAVQAEAALMAASRFAEL
jgi:hypothetical protein